MNNGFSHKEIEQAAISALLQWPKKCFPVVESFKIGSDHFQHHPNRIMFDEANEHWKNGRPLELILFTDSLRTSSKLGTVGGVGYVTSTWCNTCHAPEAVTYYCEILQEAFARKELVRACSDSSTAAHNPSTETETLLSETSRRIAAIPIKIPQRHTRSLQDLMHEKIERMERGQAGADIILTGITKLDKDSPLHKGDMPLIAGERKAGKTITALSIMLNVARNGISCLYFSLEDRETKVMDRLFASVSRIPINQHHSPTLTESGLIDKATKAASALSALPIRIKDDCYDLRDIETVSRELKARDDIGLILVDYGQLVRVPDRKDKSREQSVAEVSRNLRLLAMELDTPIILLSQLNEKGNTRESRSLEQDATAMWLVTTEEDEPSKRWIEIPWQRNGTSGIKFPVTFLGEIARVENYEQEKH